MGGVETRNIKTCQFITPSKQFMHIGHIRGVEAGEVKAGQTTAPLEHGSHTIYIRCVETGEIKICQLATSLKHSTHVGHVGGVETVTELDGGQLRTIVEHLSTTRIGMDGAGRGGDMPHGAV